MNEQVSVKTGAVDIPEACHLSWEDTYYDDEDSIVAVFEVNNEGVYRRTRGLFVVALAFLATFMVLFCIGIVTTLIQGEYEGIGISVIGAAFYGYLAYILVHYLQIMAKSKEVVHYGVHVAVTRQGVRKDMVNFAFGSTFTTTTSVRSHKIDMSSINSFSVSLADAFCEH